MATDCKKDNYRIILASASPRRREILSSMGASFTVLAADADESSSILDPVALTRELAKRKAQGALDEFMRRGDADGAIIIAADTVVACDGEILGKPVDADDARRMLRMLSGNTHEVATGIAIAHKGEIYTDCSLTHVRVDKIPESQIKAYIESGECDDKAGSYGIQGSFSRWISGIDGCYFGVVGLPVNLLSKLFYSVVGCYPDEL